MWIDKKFKIVEKIIKKESSKNMTLLDLGARDQLLKKFISDDLQYTGVDRLQNDNNNIIINLDKEFDKIKEKYDIITALDVIEHLDDPLKFYKNCKEYSKKQEINCFFYIILKKCLEKSFHNFFVGHFY